MAKMQRKEAQTSWVREILKKFGALLRRHPILMVLLLGVTSWGGGARTDILASCLTWVVAPARAIVSHLVASFVGAALHMLIAVLVLVRLREGPVLPLHARRKGGILALAILVSAAVEFVLHLPSLAFALLDLTVAGIRGMLVFSIAGIFTLWLAARLVAVVPELATNVLQGDRLAWQGVVARSWVLTRRRTLTLMFLLWVPGLIVNVGIGILGSVEGKSELIVAIGRGTASMIVMVLGVCIFEVLNGRSSRGIQ